MTRLESLKIVYQAIKEANKKVPCEIGRKLQYLAFIDLLKEAQ